MDLLEAFQATQITKNRTGADRVAVTIRPAADPGSEGMTVIAADPWLAMLTFVRSTGIAVTGQVIVGIDQTAPKCTAETGHLTNQAHRWQDCPTYQD